MVGAPLRSLSIFCGLFVVVLPSFGGFLLGEWSFRTSFFGFEPGVGDFGLAGGLDL